MDENISTLGNNSSNSNFVVSGIDEIVFQAACDHAVSYGSSLMYMADIWKVLNKKGFSEEQVHHSLEALHSLGFINKTMSFSNDHFFYVFFITSAGFEKYVQKTFQDFDTTFTKVKDYIAAVYKEGIKEKLKSESIATVLSQPKMLINHILEKLHNQGKIKLIQAERGNWMINEVY